MALAGVVQDIVHVDFDTLCMGCIDQVLEVLSSFFCRMLSDRIVRIQGVVIPDIISVIRVRRMRRAQPEGCCTEVFEIIQFLLDALEIADAVTIAVAEGIDQQLIGHAAALLSIPDQRFRDNRFGVVACLDDFQLFGERAGRHRQGRLTG